MKKTLLSICIITLLLLGITHTGEAKWWIFGKNSSGIQINYMYVNKISFDNSVDPSITLFKSNLIDGNLVIKGKASVSNGKIGVVQVSFDNKESWSKAKLSQNGSFEFAFTPEINKPYNIFVKILDTTGKTNDIEATYKKLTVSDQDISALVRAALQTLIEAYQEQDPDKFMKGVSPNFESDMILLETAIRKDFNTFDYIQLQYIINTIATGSQGRIFVSINYNRSIVSTNSGELLTDYGLTEFMFTMVNGIPKLKRIKNPLLFGLSDASNVATGTVNSGTNNPILLVDEYGSVLKKPFKDAINIIDGGNSFSTIEEGSFSLLNTGGGSSRGFFFANGTTALGSGDFEIEGNISFLGAGVSFYEIDTCPSINDVTSVNRTGYSTNTALFDPSADAGKCFAFKLADNTYAVLKQVSYTDLGGGMSNTSFQYRYQPDGSTDF